MGIMAIGRIIILSALVAQALSAPSGCIESCDFFQTSSTHQTSGSYQDHASLVQGRTNINDYDYAKPGNWTEHNQYKTDDGHGKVHEERGQYVDGPKKVRYYKQNFTASYGNVNGMELSAAELAKLNSQHRYDSLHVPSNQHIGSQSAYGLGQTVTQETGYNRVHSQHTQSSSTRVDSKNERLEDFGEYGGYSQVNQHIPSIGTQTVGTQHQVETAPGNWSRVDSYRTDGGRGQVFEEEGQYVTGPRKVHYLKKNFTSSYSSGSPQIGVDSARLDELHSELQRNLQKDLESIRRNYHQASSSGHTSSTQHVVNSVGLTQQETGFHDLQTAESDGYRQNLGYRAPSTGSTYRYNEQQRETLTDTRPYPTAAADTYGTESHRTYQSQESHVSRVHPAPQSSHLSSGYVQVPRSDYQSRSYHSAHSSGHHLDETRRAETLGAHQSSVLQNQLLTDSQRVYNPHASHATYPSRHGETRHYEEHWRSSSHGGSAIPERTITDHSAHEIGHAERAHYDRDAYNEHRARYHTLPARRFDSSAHTSGSSYDSAYRTSSGQLVTGSLDLGHAAHGADCTEETHQQYQQESRYHRKYKRDDHHGNVQEHQAIDKDFTQQNQEFGQETQQLEDLTQQSEQFTQQESDDLTQQTSGKLELGQQAIHDQHLDDLTQQSEQFTQQTEGQLEFGQQTVDNPHLDDMTQQTEGQLEFGQQTVHNPHSEDLTQQSEQFTQQTQGSDDLTQQTSGKLEFGQQTIDNHHFDDLTQQSEQFTQQAEGQLEFGQQTVHNPHSEDLTQQSEQFTQQTQGSDDLTQQTSGKLEFGQQTIDNHHLDDLTQQNEQFAQQEGQLEFGQQLVDNPHLENLTQQTQDSDDFTQQTSDKLEYGQQTVDSQNFEDLMQQTQGSDDFSQQTSGKLEFGQQNDDTQQLEQFTQQAVKSDSMTQQSQVNKHEFGQQVIDNKHLDDLTQQSEQFSQQTEDQLEFGQQSLDNQHLEDWTGQNEQFAQQTVGSDDFTQQSGKLEFGQQMQSAEKLAKPKSQRLEEFNETNKDFAQQTGELYDYSQEMGIRTHPEFGQLHSKPKVGSHHSEDTQQNEDLTQQTGGFDDFSQQTAGHLEHGQQREQHQKSSWPEYNSQHLEQHYSQQNEWNLDNLSQQSRQYPSYNKDNEQSEWQLEQMPQRTNFDQDFTQQTQNQLATNLKPAPKPKLRPRYQKHDLIPSHTDSDRTDTNIDDIFKPVEVKPEAEIDNTHGRIIESGSRPTYPEFNHHTSKASYPTQENVFDNQKENMDWAHWVHKSNDATVGLQWHYTYHPSDLTNVEDSYDNSYPRHNVGSMSQQRTEDVQQQAKPLDFNQKETQNRDKLEDEYQNSYISQSQHDKYDQQSGSFQQTEMPHFDNQFNQDSDRSALRVRTLQAIQNDQLTSEQEKRSTPSTEQPDDQPEGRILQAYGGGPYDTPHTNDFYNRVRPNPSATLPPMDYDDPWDIREKPREFVRPRTSPTVGNTPEIVTTTEAVETTTETIDTTTVQPSFWRRVGNKITNTYDKAKEKAKEIFG